MITPDFFALAVEQDEFGREGKIETFAQFTAKIGVNIDSYNVEVLFDMFNHIIHRRTGGHAAQSIIAEEFQKGRFAVVEQGFHRLHTGDITAAGPENQKTCQ